MPFSIESPGHHLTLSEAAKLTPGRPHMATLWRWCRRGVLSRNGERIRLDHQRFGRRVFTTKAALDDFARRLAQADCAAFDYETENRLPARRHASQVDLDALERELEEEGI